MIKRSVVDLPLHGGKCPPWLFEKMKRLARAIFIVIYEEFGRREVLKRLSDPFWFQALGCLLGFDWHSSGLTTTVGGAIKEGLRELFKEMGIFICGGKARRALMTPQEIEFWGAQAGLSNRLTHLINISRLVAKIDNSAIQDGFSLYFHLFIFDVEGRWCVIQQGMDSFFSYARRYHWESDNTKDFLNDPHKGIISSVKRDEVLNLASSQSEEARKAMIFMIGEDRKSFLKVLKGDYLFFRASHGLSKKDLPIDSLKKISLLTYKKEIKEFKDLLLIRGIGEKTLRALTLTAELIYNVKASRKDPVSFAYAHGGKDGYPYKLDRKTYENTIQELEEIILKIKSSNREKLELLRKLPTLFWK